MALDVPEPVRARLAELSARMKKVCPNARWVRLEGVHITLKFIGEKKAEAVEDIKRVLSEIHGSAFEISFRGHGFFPTAKAARVFWIGIQAGPDLAKLAGAVDEATHQLGIPKEEHAFSPHLTLARGGGRSGAPGWRKADGANKNFGVLQEKLAAMPAPEFGTMTAREFFLYESQLMRGGSRYTKIARFALA